MWTNNTLCTNISNVHSAHNPYSSISSLALKTFFFVNPKTLEEEALSCVLYMYILVIMKTTAATVGTGKSCCII